MNKHVLSFGEILLRFSPNLQGEWIKKTTMPVYVGGAELNVATALAKWGISSKYCTAMPQNTLADEIKTHLTNQNIDTTAIKTCGERIGIYYLPQGVDLKNAGVIYDRTYSSFSTIKRGMIDWENILENISWFHFSAISPAINENVADVCLEALEIATKKNITVSVDLNYRAKLWKYKKSPIEIMPSLVEYCDVIMGNIWAANTLLGIPIGDNIVSNTKITKEDYLAQSIKTATLIQQKFARCKVVANTFRFDANQEGINYYTTLYRENKQYVSPELYTEKVIDKVGSGDCFMAGLIYGLINENEPQQIINFASRAAFVKLQEMGDSTQKTVQEIDDFYKR